MASPILGSFAATAVGQSCQVFKKTWIILVRYSDSLLCVSLSFHSDLSSFIHLIVCVCVQVRWMWPVSCCRAASRRMLTSWRPICSQLSCTCSRTTSDNAWHPSRTRSAPTLRQVSDMNSARATEITPISCNSVQNTVVAPVANRLLQKSATEQNK